MIEVKKGNMIFTACRESGDFIESVNSIEEGIDKIKDYEEDDKHDGIYEENFYDVVDINHNSLL